MDNTNKIKRRNGEHNFHAAAAAVRLFQSRSVSIKENDDDARSAHHLVQVIDIALISRTIVRDNLASALYCHRGKRVRIAKAESRRIRRFENRQGD